MRALHALQVEAFLAKQGMSLPLELRSLTVKQVVERITLCQGVLTWKEVEELRLQKEQDTSRAFIGV